MSDTSTKWMIDRYVETADAPRFLSGFFQSPARNFHNSEFVELDVMRDLEEVAVAITDLSAGAKYNESSRYTNKQFKPPVYNEKGAVRSFDMLQRRAGSNPFENVDYMRAAKDDAFVIAQKLQQKVARAVELQASQVLQTGKLTLTDENGASVYALDFAPKTSHFATVGTVWATDGSTGDPMGDIAALANVIRRDGKRNPKTLIFGKSAMQRFLANAVVKSRLDQLGIKLGQLAPQTRGQGATFYGYIWIEYYQYELWLYDGFYKHPQTGTLTNFVADDKIIFMSDGGRLDLTFGNIPLLVPPESRALSFLPQRISSEGKGIDMSMNSWVNEDGTALFVSVGSRPLCIPTAIDTFGCLDVVP